MTTLMIASGYPATTVVTKRGIPLVASVPGTVVSLPDQDAKIAEGNGWIFLGLTGTTAQRPVGTADAPIKMGARYYDTTLTKPIVWDGVSWRDYTGTAV